MIGAGLFWLIEPLYGWQTLYWVGAFPAVLAVVVRLGLKEPERWIAAKAAAADAVAGATHQMGRMSELFSPRWRRNTLVGFFLGVAGVLGLWGVGFFSPELVDASFPQLTSEAKGELEAVLAAKTPDAQLETIAALDDEAKGRYAELVTRRLKPALAVPAETALTTPLGPAQAEALAKLLEMSLTPKEMTTLKAKGLLVQQIGAFFGILLFSIFAARMGRRPAFLIAFLVAWFSVAFVFYFFHRPEQVWWMFPLLGFGTLAPFGGYALYFPELFPTRLRTTGTGFCYNTGRFVSALGPAALGLIASSLHGKFETPGFRLAALVVSCAYAIGIVALIWAPETLNEPLPEDERIVAH